MSGVAASMLEFVGAAWAKAATPLGLVGGEVFAVG